MCVDIRVLETLDRVADAIPVMENETLVQENVVVEVVTRSQTTLQQNGLTTCIPMVYLFVEMPWDATGPP